MDKERSTCQVAISRIIRGRRTFLAMSRSDLARRSGVSVSYIVRIERGDRFPSGQVLRKMAGPLGLKEEELMVPAGYLSSPNGKEEIEEYLVPGGAGRLDPYVVSVLEQEPAAVQRAVIGILTVFNNIRKASGD